jgi:hypothetical protein
MMESLGRSVGSMHTVMVISVGHYGVHPFLSHTVLTPYVAFKWTVVACEIVIQVCCKHVIFPCSFF